MSTLFDLATMCVFAGLAVLFLQRSISPTSSNDRIAHYLPPAVGLALANWFGNGHQEVVAVVLIVAVIGYIAYVLKPFQQSQ